MNPEYKALSILFDMFTSMIDSIDLDIINEDIELKSYLIDLKELLKDINNYLYSKS